MGRGRVRYSAKQTRWTARPPSRASPARNTVLQCGRTVLFRRLRRVERPAKSRLLGDAGQRSAVARRVERPAKSRLLGDAGQRSGAARRVERPAKSRLLGVLVKANSRRNVAKVLSRGGLSL